MKGEQMDLKEKVKSLPSSPGVYLMKDSSGSIIYVGKSKNLKNRVSSYFHSSKSHSPKVVKLVKNIKTFEYILTDTEFEAFMLECKLIKELKPLYNRLMKNPLSYAYIKIKISEKYPSIDFSNERVESDGNLYFGPYTSKNTVERAIQGIKENCKLLCSSISRSNSSCLNYSLGLCVGVCMGNVEKEQYDSIIDSIINLLSCTDRRILDEMETTMHLAAERFDFETAAKYRDYISAVSYLLSREKVIEFTEENKNIVFLEILRDNNVKFFLIKGNRVLFSSIYKLDNLDVKQLKADILISFKNKELNSDLKVDRNGIDEAQIIYSYLKNSNCRYVILPDKWLNKDNSIALEKALAKLLKLSE
jgi:excinuclease ABC subunit C